MIQRFLHTHVASVKPDGQRDRTGRQWQSMLPVLDLADADADLPCSGHGCVRPPTTAASSTSSVTACRKRSSIEVLRLAREFFALPLDAKNEISQLKSPQFRGYSRLGGELTNGKVDWREQIDIGPERQVIDGAEGYWRLQGPNLWPSTPSGFRAAFEEWDAALSGVGLAIAAALGGVAGRRRGRVRRRLRGPPATLIKVVRYPGTDETPQGVGAHKDSGVLTLLLVEPDSEGLQVELGPRRVDRRAAGGRRVHRQHRRAARGRHRRLPARDPASRARPAAGHATGCRFRTSSTPPSTPSSRSSRCHPSWRRCPAESKPTRTIRSSTPTARTPGSREHAPTPTSPNCTTASQPKGAAAAY